MGVLICLNANWLYIYTIYIIYILFILHIYYLYYLYYIHTTVIVLANVDTYQKVCIKSLKIIGKTIAKCT